MDLEAQLIALVVAGLLGQRTDANETAMITRQLLFVKQKSYDILYPERKFRQIIPVSHDVPNGAETFAYEQYDSFGMAAVIANYATDFPRVDVVKKEFQIPIKSIGDSYQYSVQDLRRSALAGGQPLDQRRGLVARAAIEAKFEDIAAKGITGTSMTGFFNNANVPVVTPITGTWSGATAAQIVADINKLINSVRNTTKQLHEVNTVVLPVNLYSIVAAKPYGTAENSMTVLKVLQENNPGITFIPWIAADTGSASNANRIVALERNENNLSFEIPQEFEQMPPEARAMAFVVHCHARAAGVAFYYPLSAAYMDGC